MIIKEKYLVGIFIGLTEVSIDNIQVAYELFKHYGFDLNKEKPDRNGNILCEDCENCFNCVFCSDCVDCENCWCLDDSKNETNMFSNVDYIKNLRNEPLNEEDEKDLQRCIEYADYAINN